MSRSQALDVMRSHGADRIADCYDTDGNVPEALAVLMPGYEYPDVSHLTGAEILVAIGEE